MPNIKQIHTPYWLWEDWLNGMWRKLPKDQESLYLQKAIEFTGDTELYGMAMQIVISEWPHTMLNSLTNKGINKRAFLGQCAACYGAYLPEYITRLAWYKLTQYQRDLADNEAEKCIKKYLTTLQNGNHNAIQMEYLMKSKTKLQTSYPLTKEFALQF